MGSLDFFAAHPVFTYNEFIAAHQEGRERSERTAANLLAHHVAAGRLVHVRRGLYAVVPPGASPDSTPVDPYLLATKLAPEAIVAYHAALQFHGRVYSVWQRFTYLTRTRAEGFSFRGMEFVPVQAPRAVRDRVELGGGVVEQPYAGGRVRVATLERTLVDVLDAPEHGGGWEEIWRSLELVEFFNLDAVIEYALRLGSALTIARVGFFLEQHREELMVEDWHLERLRQRAPGQPQYLDSRREPGRLVKAWNLVVPERVLTRSWAEVV